MSRARLIIIAVSLTALFALTVACASSEPTGATAEEVQAAMQAAVQQAQQQGVTQEDMANAIQQALATQEQGASASDVAAAVQSAMAAQPGVTQADVATAISQALEARPGVTQADVANAIASALAENQGDTEQQVADAIAQALRQQTPGLTEAEVSEAIAKALAERPGVTQEDIQMAVESAVAKAVPAQAPAPVDSMMGPSGKVIGAVQSVGSSSGWPTDCVWCATFPNIGAGEALITATRAADGSFITEPWVAESWTLNTDDPDAMYIDWKIREGIMFHNGWGELTAEDVVFTYNAGNPGITPEARHDTLPRPDIGRNRAGADSRIRRRHNR